MGAVKLQLPGRGHCWWSAWCGTDPRGGETSLTRGRCCQGGKQCVDCLHLSVSTENTDPLSISLSCQMSLETKSRCITKVDWDGHVLSQPMPHVREGSVVPRRAW